MKKIFIGIFIISLLLTALSINLYNGNRINQVSQLITKSQQLSAEDLSQDLIRFHVIANSDMDYDQNVKIKIRDSVLEYMIPKLNKCTNKKETINTILSNQSNISDMVNKMLKNFNMNYSCKIGIDSVNFPTKYYGDFSLPAGEYTALRIILGNGEGSNWWCVLFPPLCLINVKKEESGIIQTNEEIYENEQEKIQTNEEIQEDEQQIIQTNEEMYEDEIIQANAEDNKEMISVNEQRIKDQKEVNKDTSNKIKIKWKTFELLGLLD